MKLIVEKWDWSVFLTEIYKNKNTKLACSIVTVGFYRPDIFVVFAFLFCFFKSQWKRPENLPHL